MTTTTAGPTSEDTPAFNDERLPWPSLLVLGAATLIMVTAEMLPTAVLTPMSDGLGVAESRTASLVSVWAGVVVIASFPLVRLFRRWDRRTVIVAGLLAVGASSLFTAIAPGYTGAVAARLLGAAAVGLLWATINTHVADLVTEKLLGTAVAVVLGGATLGMVVGTPLARLLADVAGWRAAFGALAVLGVTIALAVRVVVPVGRRIVANDQGQADAGVDRRSPAPMIAVAVFVALLLVGHYGAYTFITRIAEEPAAALPGGVSTLLLAFGVASAAGVALAGRVGAHTAGALVVTAGLTAVALLGLSVVESGVVVGLAIVVLWGVVSGSLAPLAQTEILRLAGTEHRTTAGALIPVLFNGGIAAGAALSAFVVDQDGVGALAVPMALIVAVAAIGLAVTRRR